MLRPGHGDQCCEKVLDVATELINHSCGYLQVRLVQFQNRSAGVVCVCVGGAAAHKAPPLLRSYWRLVVTQVRGRGYFPLGAWLQA